MLQLKNITKDYKVGDEKVHALRGVSIDFRESEFVSILGQSGCGKTTLLNIIGGLDRYTDGNLIISGKSTKEFKNADWDTYRNHSIGFVFQSYNLIPHQTVLSNVACTDFVGRVKSRKKTKSKGRTYKGRSWRPVQEKAQSDVGRSDAESCNCQSACKRAGHTACR